MRSSQVFWDWKAGAPPRPGSAPSPRASCGGGGSSSCTSSSGGSFSSDPCRCPRCRPPARWGPLGPELWTELQGHRTEGYHSNVWIHVTRFQHLREADFYFVAEFIWTWWCPHFTTVKKKSLNVFYDGFIDRNFFIGPHTHTHTHVMPDQFNQSHNVMKLKVQSVKRSHRLQWGSLNWEHWWTFTGVTDLQHSSDSSRRSPQSPPLRRN